MLKRVFVLVCCLFIASTVGAQDKNERRRPYNSVKEGTGYGNPPSARMKHHGGWGGLKTSDGEPHVFKSAGVVIFNANTYESGDSICIDATELIDNGGVPFKQGLLQSLVFVPSPKRSQYLEIVWSGMAVVESTDEPSWTSYDQQAFFKCTVSQRGESVPCSGTLWIPTIAQDTSGAGLTEFSTYHGYVEIDPKAEVTVEIWVWAAPDTVAYVCGDTLTLKY